MFVTLELKGFKEIGFRFCSWEWGGSKNYMLQSILFTLASLGTVVRNHC